MCGVCQWKIQSVEPSATCPACGVAYHADCWRDNKGCAAYGCSQVNVLAEKEDLPAHEESGSALLDPDLRDLADALQPRSLEIPILAGVVLASLLGLVGFGAPPLIMGAIAFGYMLVRRGKQRMILLAAVIIAFIGTLAGVLASLYWWMQITPMELIGK